MKFPHRQKSSDSFFSAFRSWFNLRHISGHPYNGSGHPYKARDGIRLSFFSSQARDLSGTCHSGATLSHLNTQPPTTTDLFDPRELLQNVVKTASEHIPAPTGHTAVKASYLFSYPLLSCYPAIYCQVSILLSLCQLVLLFQF